MTEQNEKSTEVKKAPNMSNATFLGGAAAVLLGLGLMETPIFLPFALYFTVLALLFPLEVICSILLSIEDKMGEQNKLLESSAKPAIARDGFNGLEESGHIVPRDET